MTPPQPRRWPLSAATLAWVGLGLVYAATRLINLTQMPLFTDEGIYLWFGRQVLLGDLSRGWGQGKPLMAWLIATLLALVGNQSLAARLGIVLVSALGLASAAHLAAKALSPSAALATALLWVLVPFTLYFERLATPDVVLGALVVPALDVAWHVLHANRVRPIMALLAGALFVLAALAKLPVSLFFFSLPVGISMLAPATRSSSGRTNAFWLLLIPAFFAAGIVAIGGYRWWANASPIGFGFDEILLKSALGGQASGPIKNLASLVAWAGLYLGWPLTLGLVAAWLSAWFGPPLARLLTGASGIWLTIFVCVSSYWVPRYIWPVLPLLLMVVGWGAATTIEKLIALWTSRRSRLTAKSMAAPLLIACIVALSIPTMPLNWSILRDPSRAALPVIDLFAYVTGPPAGYGLPEAAVYLANRLPTDPVSGQVILLNIQDEARLRAYLPASLWPRLRQVQIVSGQNQDSGQQMAQVRAWLPEAAVTYVVVGSSLQWSADWQAAFPQATAVAQFPKPGGQDAVTVLRLPAP